jgi:hypothetical protein
MGHSIEHQFSVGECHLSQCSCGRGALKLNNKTLLLSAAEIKTMTELFSALAAEPTAKGPGLVEQLKRLTDGKQWEEFSVPQ